MRMDQQQQLDTRAPVVSLVHRPRKRIPSHPSRTLVVMASFGYVLGRKLSIGCLRGVGSLALRLATVRPGPILIDAEALAEW